MLPGIKQGRPKADNNDAELVIEGLQAIRSGKYKNYSEAARALAPRARERLYKKINGKGTFECVIPAIDLENVARRIAKKISKECKEKPYE